MTRDEAGLTERFAREIAAEGPMPLVRFMAGANAHYYATRDPLGAEGDFVTAPEISQMFGELIGLWLADLWTRAGSPQDAHYVELGPGRGTLAEDALRAMRAVRFEPPIDLVETSPVLRRMQAERLPTGRWHDDFDEVPKGGPLLIVANEFFDALPVRQLCRDENGWRELSVGYGDEGFAPVMSGPDLTALVPPALRDAEPGSVIETSAATTAVAGALASRLAEHGGTALIIDYGYEGPALGDTLQAVSRHAYADIFAAPGTRDLTAHVDFGELARIGREAGLQVHGPVEQGMWLESMGLGARTAALAKAAPHRREELIAARDRLTNPAKMGRLFKVLAFTSQSWPDPAAF